MPFLVLLKDILAVFHALHRGTPNSTRAKFFWIPAEDDFSQWWTSTQFLGGLVGMERWFLTRPVLEPVSLFCPLSLHMLKVGWYRRELVEASQAEANQTKRHVFKTHFSMKRSLLSTSSGQLRRKPKRRDFDRPVSSGTVYFSYCPLTPTQPLTHLWHLNSSTPTTASLLRFNSILKTLPSWVAAK